MEGTEINNPNSIKEAVPSFYKELYKETEQWRPDLNLHGGTKITVEEHAWQQRPFEEEETVKCLNMCTMEKAPGPDGFPMVFFKNILGHLEEGHHRYFQFFPH